MQRKWVVSLAIDGQDEITAEGTMNAIDQLMAEHELIVEVLDALDGYASNVERGTEVEPSDLAELVRFLREFADGCHHAKEEGILFAAMEQAGFPREMGPLAVMLAEHEQGRGYIARLRAVADRAPDWSAADRTELAAAAHDYAALLRRHIAKEDGILFPMAQARLDREVMARVTADFERFEREQTGPGEHEKLHALAGQRTLRYAGRPGEQAAAHAHGHACCG